MLLRVSVKKKSQGVDLKYYSVKCCRLNGACAFVSVRVAKENKTIQRFDSRLEAAPKTGDYSHSPLSRLLFAASCVQKTSKADAILCPVSVELARL